MKERIIMEYDIGDDCTWGAIKTVPMFADRSTVEEEFMLLAYEAKNNKQAEFTFANHEFDVSNFFYYERYDSHDIHYKEPRFFTVDQYFSWTVHE